MTLRKLIEMIGEEHMDTPLTISAYDQYRNNTSMQMSEDWPARGGTGAENNPKWCALTVFSRTHRFVEIPKDKR